MVRSFNEKTPELTLVALALARLESIAAKRDQSLSTSKAVSMAERISSSVKFSLSA